MKRACSGSLWSPIGPNSRSGSLSEGINHTPRSDCSADPAAAAVDAKHFHGLSSDPFVPKRKSGKRESSRDEKVVPIDCHDSTGPLAIHGPRDRSQIFNVNLSYPNTSESSRIYQHGTSTLKNPSDGPPENAENGRNPPGKLDE